MKAILPSTLLALCVAFAQAADEPSSATAEAAARALNADVKPMSAREQLEEAFDAFARERKVSFGVPDKKGVTYFKHQLPVQQNSASAQFIKSRAMAYEKAYQDALTLFVTDLTGRTAVESLREYTKDDSDDQYDKPKTLAETSAGIMKKAVVLTEAKLDEALRKAGVDPQKYEQRTPAEKRVLFRDAILRKSMTRAAGSVAGIVPVQTFEARTESGQYAIGVILRSDPAVKEIARCIAQKKRTVVLRDGGLALADVLPPADDILGNFGVRLYFNEKGLPALLSFGQYGLSYTGDDERKLDREIDAALQHAQGAADDNLTLFINGMVSSADERVTGEAAEEAIEVAGDGNYTEAETTKMISRITKQSTLTASDTMAGRSTVFKRMLRHPNGHRVAVVVRQWSYEQLDAVDAILNGPKMEAPKAPGVKVQDDGAGVRKGRSYDF